ncbi:LacI family DNA-binding transcriptional regulator [Thermoflavimicrobium dichotomicum]|uniref:LacI family transcriptional regulator, kdg operon repressor n=1 Tax=Thermoflavimicrobium dichotomicum TaxID=46223 RepID=A0A1I3TLW3_9BACL|nr:LacI family DNA-binding transcriptional regulator [Thermoflavimicrobium dichotomicum]SFJ71610.1 LacI family transcriptional regulator, kdg operon repressor [Thermoflavimicrobium dichotomicum]
MTRKKQTDRVTITDVARVAGVSKTTVSRYLGGQYHVLSESTQARIKEAIEQLNYRPNQMARGLKRDRSYLIGMVMADISNPYSTAVLRGAEDVCKQKGYSILVCNTDNDPAKEREYILMLQSHRIDGLLINTTGKNNDFLRELANDCTPVVLIDRKVPVLGFDTVGLDNEQATSEAIHFLLNRGYKRIAYVSEPIAGVSSRRERAAVFTALADQYGYSADDLYEVNLQSPERLSEVLDHFLQRTQGEKPVIFAANGVVLLKLIRALQSKGISVPEDVAVISFDDTEWAALIGSGITAIAQPTYQIGMTAMERIFQRMEGDGSPAQNIAFAGKLIIRGSTPPVV